MISIEEKLSYINSYNKNVNIMEVCGTHTNAIGKMGLRNLLSPNIKLISGPGCPVCVTPDFYIDYVYNLATKEDFVIATYGDMIRVPGSKKYISLEMAKAMGAQVKIVYSSVEALNLARTNRDKKILFLGIGFETTAPATAIAIKEAYKEGLTNFYVLSMHKVMEPIMKLLLEDEELKIDGFLCPGHVASIIGEKGFEFLQNYECFGVIAGFESKDILDSIYLMIKNIKEKNYGVINGYNRLVSYLGNIDAQRTVKDVFDIKEDYWRGIGRVEDSGLKLKDQFGAFDIEKLYPIEYNDSENKNGCSCGEVLKGKILPRDCKLFGQVCNPDNPVGPCMVSNEGSCAAYYKYI